MNSVSDSMQDSVPSKNVSRWRERCLNTRTQALLILAAALFACHSAQAAGTTFTIITGTNGPWDTTANWSGGGIGAGTGNIATVGTGIGTSGSIALDVNETLGQLTNTGTTNFTVTAAGGTFTFDNTGGVNNIFGNSDAAISTNGTGSLTVNPNIVIQNTSLDIGSTSSGVITLGTSSASTITASTSGLGLNFRANSTGNITVNNSIGLSGSSIAISNLGTGSGAVTLAGVVGTSVSGVTENSAGSTLVLSGNNTFSGGVTITSGTVTLNTNTTAAGTGTIAVGANTLNITGLTNLLNTITGSGTINVGGAVTTQLTTSNWNGFTGTINVSNSGATNKFTISTASPNLNSLATVNVLNGATFYVAGITNNSLVDIIGTGNSEGFGALRIQSGTQAGNVLLTGNATIGSQGGAGVISGTISDGGHAFALTEDTGSTTSLTAANTYTGLTTINSGGTLQLGNASTTGALATTGAIVDNGTLSFNRTNAVTQGVDFSSSGITGTGGFTQAGTGATTLNASNTYTGVTNVNAGQLLLTAGSNTSSSINVGTVNPSAAAVYQSGGTITTSGAGEQQFNITNAVGAFGYYKLSSGTVTLGNGSGTNGGEFDVGGGSGGAGTFGQFDMSGGTINMPNTGSSFFLMDRGAAGQTGVFNLSGGTVQIAGGGTPTNTAIDGLAVGLQNVGNLTSTVTISGSGQFLTPSLTVKLNDTNFGASSNSTNVSYLNLNGGTLQTLGFGTAVNTGGGNGSAVLNFNGGTLKAGTAGNTSFLSSLGSVFVNSGGGTIDNNSQNITIGQALLTPTGSGVTSVAVTTPGSGYTVPPKVTFTGGTGSGATGYATIDPTTGAVTGIVITNPGNYSVAPTGYTLTAQTGFSGTAATTGAITTAANTSGGMTFNGLGTTTLTGASTYTGTTTINNGTLNLGGAGATGAISSSSALALGGGTLNYTETGNTTQSFNGTTINAGLSAITAVAGDTINLGSITRNIAGVVNFGSTGTINTTTTTNVGGILGGYATFGGNTWAVAPAVSGGAITGLASYTTTTANGNTASNYASSQNIDVTSAPTLTGPVTVNTLRFNTAAAETLTLTGTNVINTGGILVSSTVANNLSTITGGTLEGASGDELTVSQNNATNGLTIASIIADNTSATGLVKAGSGLLTLTGANTYTGATIIGAGTLQIGSGGTTGSLSTSSAITDNGTLTFNRSNTVTQGTDFSGAAIIGTGGLTQAGTGSLVLNAANTYTGATTLSGGTLILAANAGNTAGGTSAALSASTTVTLGVGTTLELLGNTNNTVFAPTSVVESGNGTYNFFVGNNGSGTGNTLILANMGQFGLGSTAPTFNLTGSNGYTLQLGSGSSGTGALNVFNNTAINSNTAGVTLSMPGGITINFALPYTLTYGGAGNISTGALVQNGANALTVNYGGTGTLALTGNSTYTGATTVNGGGTLALGNGGNLAATAVTVSNAGSTFAIKQNASATTNALTGSLSLGAGTVFTMVDGFTSTFNVTGASTLAPASGASPTLSLEIGSASGTSDKLAITGSATVGAGGAFLNISPIAAPSSSANTYTLITAASGLNTNFILGGVTNYNIGGTIFHLTLGTSTATSEIASFVSGTASATTAFWTGSQGNSWATLTGGTNSNFTFDAAGTYNTFVRPDLNTNVTFTANSAANLSTTLDQAFTINSLTFSGTGTSNTAGSTIAAGTGGAASTLTINAAALNGNAAGNGITVAAGSGSNTISANVVLGASQTWTNNSANALTVSGNVTGSGFGITKSGTGAVVLSGTDTYSGATTISSGTLQFSGTQAMSSSSALTLGTGATLNLNSDVTGTFTPASTTGAAGGAYTIAVNQLTGAGAGKTLTLANAFTIGTANSGNSLTVSSTSGDTLLLSSQLNLANNGNGASSTITLTGANMTLNAGVNYNGNANGPTLTVNAGSNTLLINGNWTTGNNRWSGIALNNGTLTMANGQNGGSSTNNGVYAVLNGGTLNLNSNTAIGGVGAGNSFTINGGTVNNTSGAAVTLTDNPHVSIGGSFTYGALGGTGLNNLNLGSGTVTLTASSTITTLGSGTLTLPGVISGAFNLAKSGTGNLSLTGANTYSGTTSINGGLLLINTVATGTNAQALGSGTSGTTVTLGVASTSSGTLQYTGGTGTLDKNISALGNGGDTIKNTGGGLLTLTGTLTKANTVLTLASGSFNVTGQITGGNSSTFNSDFDVNGATVTVSATNNNYFGPTVVYNGGTLLNGTNNALPTGTVLTTGSSSDAAVTNTYNLSGFNQSIAALTSAGSGTNIVTNTGASTLTITGTNADNVAVNGTFAGSVRNGTGLTTLAVTGGVQTFSGTNTNSVTSISNGGTLVVGANNALLTTGTVILGENVGNTSGTLQLGNSSGAFNQALSSTNVQIAGTGSGNAIVGGNSTISSTLTLNSAGPVAYSAQLGGSGANQNNLALVTTGAGALTLSGTANTYSGPTTVSAGTLNVTGAILNSPVTVQAGAGLTGLGNNLTTGLIGGLVTMSGSSTLSLSGASNSTSLTLANGLTLGNTGAFGAANYATVGYTINTANNVEVVNLGTNGLFSGTLTVNSGGALITVNSQILGTYTLFDAGSIVGGSNFTLSSGSAGVTSLQVGANTDTLTITGSTVVLTIAGTAVPGVAYYKGGVSSVWNAIGSGSTNWSTDLAGATDAGNTPGVTTDVIFSASTQSGSAVATTLGANTSINSLNFNSQGAGTTINADGSVLTINANGDSNTASDSSYTGNAAGTGINIAAGAGPVTINVPVVTGSSQTWTNGSGSLFTVSGSVMGSAGISALQTLTLSNTSSGNTQISGVIADGANGGQLALAVNSSGAGVTLLSASNTYTGGTTLTAGGLQLGNNTALGSTVNLLTINGGTLDLNAFNLGVGNFTGSGGVVTNNGGSLSTLTVGNGDNGGGNYQGVIQDGGGVVAVTKTGTNTVTLSGTNTYSGVTTVNNGTLVLTQPNGSAGFATGVAFNLTGGTLSLLNDSSVTFNDISNSNTVNLSGTSTINVNRLASGTGQTLDIGVVAPSGAFTLNVTGGNGYVLGMDYLQLNGSATINATTASVAIGSGGTGVFGTGTVTLSGSATGNTIARITTIGGGGLTVTGGGWTLAGNNTYTGATSITGGTLTITGTLGNTAVTDNGGTLVLGNAAAIATNPITFSSGTFLTTAPMTVANNFADTGAMTIGGSNNLTLSGVFTNSGGNNVLTVNNTGSTVLSGSVNLSESNTARTLTINGSANVTISGVVANGGTGAGGLTYAGTGTLLLNNANTYSGTTTISSGVVQLGNANTVQNSTVSIGVTNGLAFSSAIGAFNIGGLSGSGNEALTDISGTAVTLSIGGNNASTTYSGVLSGSGAIAKAGSGTLTLSGANTYSGGATLNAGTLVFGNASALGGGTATLNGGTLKAGGGFTLANKIAVSSASVFDMAGNNAGFTGNLSGSGALTLNNSGSASTLSLSGTNSGFTGTITFNPNNAVNFNSASAGSAAAAWVFNDTTVDRVRINIGNGTINFGSISGGGQIENDSASTTSVLSVGALNTSTTFNGTIDNNGTGIIALTKVGSGTLTLAGNDTYTGTTSINGGELNVGNVNALAGGGNIAFGGGALQYSGSNQVDYSSRFVGSGSAIAIDTNSQAVTFAGNIGSSNTGGLTKSGAGTLTLSGSDTYGGATNINAGTLAVNGSVSSNVNVNNTGTLSGTGKLTGAVTVSAGGVTSPGIGSSAGVLTSDLAYDSAATADFNVASGSSAAPQAHLSNLYYSQMIVTGTAGQVNLGIGTGVTIGANSAGSQAETANQIQIDGSSNSGVTLKLSISSADYTTLLANKTAGYNAASANSALDNFFVFNLGSTLSTGRFTSLEINVAGGSDVTGTIYYSGANDRFAADGIGNTIGDVFIGTQEFALSYTGLLSANSTTGGNDIVLTAIPEPSTWGMILGGFGMLIGIQRLRKRQVGT
ncbi:MAG: autotransporter-associated beta strand repeat-containing protein [Chthoniobacteraceae bacterium]